MKKLDNYLRELNGYMEEKAGEKEISFTPPSQVPPGRRNLMIPLTAAAAALLIVPVLTVSLWRKVTYDNLIREENSLFISALIEGSDDFGFDDQGASGYFSESDWFDMEKGNL